MVLAIGVAGWVASVNSHDGQGPVYQVTIVEAAQGADAVPATRVEFTLPDAAPVAPDPTPSPPAKTEPEKTEQPQDLAASADPRTREAKPDSESVDHVGRMRAGSGVRDGPVDVTENQPVGTPSPGVAEGIEVRGSPVPLNITRPESYSEAYVILHAVNPKYPEHERERGIEGSVTVEVVVDEFGFVANANVLELDGPDSFRTSALDAVRQFVFQPPVENGVPSAMWIRFRIKFRING